MKVFNLAKYNTINLLKEGISLPLLQGPSGGRIIEPNYHYPLRLENIV